MNDIADHFSALPLFSGLLPAQQAAGAAQWQHRLLPAGTDLWAHSDIAREMAIILSGSLEVCISGRRVGLAGAGELVGEAAAWSGGMRTASVRAAEDTALAILPSSALPGLRANEPAFYDCLLEEALLGLARRVRLVDREIARHAYGEGSAPERRPEGSLARLWRRLTTSSKPMPPSARQALRAMPALKAVHGETLGAIEGALTPRHLPAGSPVFIEGDPGDSVFVVAEGCVDVIRHVRGGRGERLASLYQGALFGTGSLLLRERRNASCVAAETTACWVFEMNQDAFSRLLGEPGRVWRESVLEALRFQISRADEQLARLKQGGEPVGSTDYERIRAGLI